MKKVEREREYLPRVMMLGLTLETAVSSVITTLSTSPSSHNNLSLTITFRFLPKHQSTQEMMPLTMVQQVMYSILMTP